MGWKSTIDVTRQEALDALKNYLDHLEQMGDDALAEALEVMRGGEDHGHNYRIVDKES